jgi:hypothetical protein
LGDMRFGLVAECGDTTLAASDASVGRDARCRPVRDSSAEHHRGRAFTERVAFVIGSVLPSDVVVVPRQVSASIDPKLHSSHVLRLVRGRPQYSVTDAGGITRRSTTEVTVLAMTAPVEVSTVSAGARKVSRRVAVSAPAAEIFALIADPQRHPELDGSGTLRDLPVGRYARYVRSPRPGLRRRHPTPITHASPHERRQPFRKGIPLWHSLSSGVRRTFARHETIAA